ncbi:MAG: type II toxin-antitoxin system VapC family toxin, partial [Prochlorotrichaceae cyanobacterium]
MTEFFLDTSFIQALLNSRDQYHERARILLPTVQNAQQVLTTEAILLEVGNALSTYNRPKIYKFLQQLYQTENVIIINIDPPLFQQGLDLYGSRSDKTWGLVDCLSFVVMWRESLTYALTADRHFRQAG